MTASLIGQWAPVQRVANGYAPLPQAAQAIPYSAELMQILQVVQSAQKYVDLASTSASAAAGYMATSSMWALAASLAASTAESVAGPTYATIALGLAATPAGQSFAVANSNDTVTVYLNSAGSAVFQRNLATTAGLALATGANLVGWQFGTFTAGTVGAKLCQMAASPLDYHAQADAWQFTGATINSGALAQLVLPAGGWKASAVTVGNPICVVGAGPGGNPLVTTIAAVSGLTITLATPASQAVSSAIGDFGTDDTAAVQAAIAAAEAIGGAVDFGPRAEIYYIAGASYQSSSDNWPQGFNRGSLQISSAVTLRGDGATLLLSGGRLNPGGLFWNDFFTTPSQQLGHVQFECLTLDCNIAAQYWAALPAGFSTGQVWQWGHPICLLGARGVSVRRCTIRNARGNGVAVGSYVDPSGNVWQADRVEVLSCEFSNCFMTAAQIAANDIEIADNWVHGDGYWVSAWDIETDGNTDEIKGAKVLRNVIDFRDGLAPVERNTANATNTPAAAAARIHLRRAVSSGGWTTGFAGNAWNGKLLGLRIAENTIYQGVIDVAAFCDFEIEHNAITITAETIPAGSILIGYNAIQMLPGADGNATTGLVGAKIQGNFITSVLPGYGIYVVDYAGVQITGNVVNGVGLSGIRTDVSSGHVTQNQLTNCCGAAAMASDYAAIAIFGVAGTPLDVLNNHVIDNRGTPLTRLAVYGNVALSPMTRLSGNVCFGFTPLAPSSDGSWASSPAASPDGTWSPANNAYAVANLIAASGGVTSTPLANLVVSGPLSATGAVRFGDTTGSNDASVTYNLGPSGTAKTFYTDNAGLEYQDVFSSAGGRVWQRFSDGEYQWTDLAFDPTGLLLLNLTWKQPLKSADGTYRWSYGGQSYHKASAPTGPTDGTTGW